MHNAPSALFRLDVATSATNVNAQSPISSAKNTRAPMEDEDLVCRFSIFNGKYEHSVCNYIFPDKESSE